MTTEGLLIDSALRYWKLNVDRAHAFFSGLSEEQLLREIAPGKNRLIYLWGHLTAINDAMIPLLGLGERLHPELDPIFVKNPDRAITNTLSGEELKRIWDETNQLLWMAFSTLSPSDWVQKHTAISDEDFLREPHRNRLSVLLSRAGHISYHLGQAILGK